jgi:RNA polymerase sigma-70 factor, ECF subfamily
VSNPVEGDKGKGLDVLDSPGQVRFETLVLPHLDAAFNPARWLLRSGADAEDIAQESDATFVSVLPWLSWGDVRAWLLQIVRNTCYTWLAENRQVQDMPEFDEKLPGPASPTPEVLAIAGDNRELLTHALEPLPARHPGVSTQRDCRDIGTLHR